MTFSKDVAVKTAANGAPDSPIPSVEPRTSFGQIVPERMAQAQSVPPPNEGPEQDHAGLGGSTRVALRDEMRAPDTTQRDDVVLTVGRA